MTITGQFRNKNNDIITLTITKKGTEKSITINDDGDVFFSDNPVEIKSNWDGIFKPIIKKSCTINLLTKKYLGDFLFADNAKTTSVTVKRGQDIIFDGYLEPITFNQPYSNELDTITLNAVDKLSILHYEKYRVTTIDNYQSIKAEAKNVSFYEIITEFLKPFEGKIYYDGSKKLHLIARANIFKDLYLNESILFGSDYDKVQNREEILINILQYLSLHIIQEGKDFFIFNIDSLKSLNTKYIDIETDEVIDFKTKKITIMYSHHADNNTNLSISEPFNQIKLKCTLDHQSNVITSPLDKNSLKSDYPNKVKYMTLYYSDGEGRDAYDAFNQMIRGQEYHFDGAKQSDYFIQPLYSKNWTFYKADRQTDNNTLIEYENNQAVNAYKYPLYINLNRICAGLIKMGKTKDKDLKDNEISNDINLSDYLYISVNGDNKDKDGFPSADYLNSVNLLASYKNASGSIFSPNDSDTTNYIVFTGSFYLQSVDEIQETERYNNLLSGKISNDPNTQASKDVHPNEFGYNPHFWHNTVKSQNNKDGRYLTRKFYKNKFVFQDNDEILNDVNIIPIEDNNPNKLFKYSFNADGSKVDKVSYCPILFCRLIIGNKCLVRMEDNSFKWVDKDKGVMINDEKVDYFSLGINPKIDSFLLGQYHQMENTISIKMNLDGVKGTAIPIKKSDFLSGKLSFEIIGVAPLQWDNVKYRHSTILTRHSKYKQNVVDVMPKVKGIYIKDFSAKICTDNGGLINMENNKDLIYLSEEQNSYVNKNDSQNFKLITQLTAKEAFEKGISNEICINAVLGANRLPINSIYNTITSEQAKAEEHYINEYYNLLCVPKVLLHTTLKNITGINQKYLYESSGLGKTFYVVNTQHNVKNDTTKMTLREV